MVPISTELILKTIVLQWLQAGVFFVNTRQKPAVRQVFCCAPLASRFVPINSAEAAPPPKAEFDVCYLNRMATRLFRQDVPESFQRGGIFNQYAPQ